MLHVVFAAPLGAPREPGDPRMRCSFCLRDRAEVAAIVSARDVSICDACVARAVRELRVMRVEGWRRWWDVWPRARREVKASSAPPYRRADVVCSFCRKANVEDTIVAEHATICPPCVRLALDVVLEARG